MPIQPTQLAAVEIGGLGKRDMELESGVDDLEDGSINENQVATLVETSPYATESSHMGIISGVYVHSTNGCFC